MGDVEYRDVVVFDGYRVGDNGTVLSCWARIGQGRGRAPLIVKSDNWKRLKSSANTRNGSVALSLGRGNSRRVGRLVLDAFVGPCPPGMECCHYPDQDFKNCTLRNRRWGTSAENTNDQRKHGTLIGGERHGMAKLSNEQVERIRSLKGTVTQRAIANRFGISQGHVSDILNNRKRTPSSHSGKELHRG